MNPAYPVSNRSAQARALFPMNSPLLPLLSFACLLGCPALFAADGSPLAPGATVQKVSGTFAFTEGPAVDREGDIYFTDQPNDRIMKWNATNGSITTFLQPAGRANGMYFDHSGNLIACADEKNELWSISPSGKITVLLKEYQGKLFNGPNDAWVRPDDGIYFTDPLYKRPYWKRGPKEQSGEHVYFLSPDKKTCSRVADDLKQPNGIIGTPDGKILYVSDIGAGRTYAYDVRQDGTLDHKRLFCELGSDGMTIDDRGNVYLTGKGVTVFDASGRKIEHIEIPEPWTANVCFGGRERRTLFITASKSVYTVPMQTKGLTK
jgi:gluconolactonase